MGVGVDGAVDCPLDGEPQVMCRSGFVYGADLEGFREAEYGRPYRGRSVDRPDSGLVGRASVRVPAAESDDGVRDEDMLP